MLAAADLFVLPSRAEGLGIAALEAMGSATAIVATAVGGLVDAVQDGRTGLIVPPEDPRALATALTRLTGDPELRAKLAAAGPERIKESFLPEQMVSAYEELYAELLGPNAPASGPD